MLPPHLQSGYQDLTPKEMARVEAGAAWPSRDDDRLFDYEALVDLADIDAKAAIEKGGAA